MKYLWTLVFLILVPVSVAAQSLAVRTGEHNGFTRVVVRLPEGAAWEFGRVDGGYGLRVPVAEGYNLRDFFRLIPKTRIRDVAQNSDTGELLLDVACLCRATVEVYDRHYLVIDIADGEPLSNAPFEGRLLGEEKQSLIVKDETRRAPTFPVIFPQSTNSASDVLPKLNLPQMQATEQDDLRALEAMLTAGLARGLSSGMLQPDLRPAVVPVMPAAPQRPISLPGINISTGIDPVAIPVVFNRKVNAYGTECVGDDLLDMSEWSDGRSMPDQIGALRSKLIHEFDRIDPQAVDQLARLYLYFGFGREALQILQLDGVASQQREYLSLIARIIDDESVNFAGIRPYLTCPSHIALWVFLAAPDPDTAKGADPAVVLAAFKEIPVPLQRHLGPRLAERLAINGYEDAAVQALAAAQAVNPVAVETRLAAAMIAQQNGDDITALQDLTDLAVDDSRITPRAMIQFLTESIRQDRAVPESEMVTADALRFEQATLPDTIALAFTQVQAHIAAGTFDRAAQIIAENANRFGQDQLSTLRREFALAAAADMSDAEFLTFAAQRQRRDDDRDVQNKLAERLIFLGFPELALQMFGNAEPDDHERRHLIATALLFLGDLNAVNRLLRDDESERSMVIRQAARDLRAGNAAALTQLSQDADAQADWRNGQWAVLSQTDDPLLRDVAARVLNDDLDGLDSDAPLASGRILLDSAAGTRDLLDQLFVRFSLPTDD